MDTGASVSIISTKIYNSIPKNLRPPIEKSSTELKLEVANNGLLSVLGTAAIEFKIKNDVYKWDMFIAPIKDDGLLGLDFLQNHNYSLSAKNGLRLKNRKCATILKKSQVTVNRVLCRDNVVIPAQCEMIVAGYCRQNDTSGNYGIISPKEIGSDENSLLVGHTCKH